MLSNLLIFLITINAFPDLTMGSESCMKSDTAGNRTKQIQSIADYILKQLGYTEAPIVSANTTLPDKLKTDYEMQKEQLQMQREVHEEYDIKGTNAINVNTIPGKLLNKHHPSGLRSTSKRASGDGGDFTVTSYDIEFSINVDTKSYEHPDLVELMVYKKFPNCSNSQKQDNTLQMVEVIENSNANSPGKVIAVKLVDMYSSRGYISFNVTKAAVRWIEQKLNKVELTLTIKCIGPSQCDLSPEHQVRFSTSHKSMKVPHLIIKTYVPSSQPTMPMKRRRRSSTPMYNYCSNSTQTCCLKELRVNFERDLNWTFIKEPSEIIINYCNGLCPLGTGSTPTHFDVLVGIHANSSFNPCCAGADYETVTLLTENSTGNHSLLVLPNMTVKSCRCG